MGAPEGGARRPLPDRVLRWRQLAEGAGLSEPRGRALCCHARMLNGPDGNTPIGDIATVGPCFEVVG